MHDFYLETEIRFAAQKSKLPIKTAYLSDIAEPYLSAILCRMERRLFCTKSFLVVTRAYI